jgi:hypothetical protein
LAARGASRPAYHFQGEEPPGFPEPPGSSVVSSKIYRNPIALAQGWQAMLTSEECASRSALARKLGVTRARVTQVLGLLELAPQVIGVLAALGDPLPGPIVTERSLRSLVKLPVKEQTRAVQRIATKAPAVDVATIDVRDQARPRSLPEPSKAPYATVGAISRAGVFTHGEDGILDEGVVSARADAADLLEIGEAKNPTAAVLASRLIGFSPSD